MTVTSTTNRWSYTGDGTTTDFTYDNLIFETSDLKVYVDAVLQALGTDYTVSGELVVTGGTVSFLTAPAAATTVLIVRDVPETQSTVFPEGGKFPSSAATRGLDRGVVLVQQHTSILDRALRLPLSEADPTALNDLPTKAARASTFLAFDADGQPIASTGDAGSVAVSTFMETVLDDADGDAALTTLGLTAYMLTFIDDATATAARGTLGSGAVGDAVFVAATTGAAQTALGLVIGTDVQAYDAELAAIAGLVSAADKGIYFTGSGTASTFDLSSFGRTLVDDANAAAARTTLGLVIGTDVQAWDADLDTLAANISAFGQSLVDDASAAAARTTLGLVIGTDVQAWDADLDTLAANISAFGQSLVDDATAAAARATLGSTTVGDAVFVAASQAAAQTALGLVPGTDVQAQDAELAAIAGLVSAADRGIYFTGSGTASLFTLTSFARTLLDDSTAATARATLGSGAVGDTLFTAGTAAAALTAMGIDDHDEIYVDPDGTLIVGHTTAIFSTAGDGIEAHGTSTGGAVWAARWGATTAGGVFAGVKSRNASIGSHTIVQTNDTLLSLEGRGSDGSSYVTAAQIEFTVGATPGAGDMPGEIGIYTTPNASTTPTEAIYVGNSQSVQFANISTTASAANAFLDSGNSNNLLRSTSSRRYKTDIEPIDRAAAIAVLGVPRIQYRSTAQADDPARVWFGLTAEEMAAVEPRLVTYLRPQIDVPVQRVYADGTIRTKLRRVPDPDADLVPDGVAYDRLSVINLELIAWLNERVTALEAA